MRKVSFIFAFRKVGPVKYGFLVDVTNLSKIRKKCSLFYTQTIIAISIIRLCYVVRNVPSIEVFKS